MWKSIKSNRNLLISLGLGLAVMASLQIPHRQMLGDPDGFYHAKVSQLLSKGELHDNFPYLIYTTWRDGFADQHFLYHAILIPFNNIDHLYLSVIAFALLFFLVFYLLLKKLGVFGKPWWFWLLLLGSTDFLFRINLVKANTLSLALLSLIMILILFWHQTKNYWAITGLILISFLFVWTYGGFVFVPLVLGVYFLVVWLWNRQLALMPILASGLGILLGLLLHPHHSNLLVSLYNQIFFTGLGAGSQVPVGNEWLPYNWSWFVKSDVPILLIWALSLVVAASEFYKRKIKWENLWISIITILLFILCLRHRRFIEYFVPFAVLASAVTLSPYIAKLKWQQVKKSFIEYWQVSIPFTILTCSLAIGMLYNYQNVDSSLGNGESTHRFKEAAELIQVRSQNSSNPIVINTQWDQFPQLFYWNSYNYYPIGMDPTFMNIYNSDLYWKWRDVADDGKNDWGSIDQLYGEVKTQLAAEYLFVDNNRNSNISEYIDIQDPDAQYFEKIYNSNDGVVVYKLK